MGEDYPLSEEQFAAVTAPLEPGVVVAGAGSGKTTVMAARVVWLTATGQVTPDEVLGLTFTTKAANELGVRIRSALRRAGLLPEPGAEDADEPTVATYNAYAANLLSEHGLRIGHEPDTRVIADASRYQLAARAIARHTQRVELLSDHPETVINYVLALDGAMSEHLVVPDDVRALQDRERPLWQAGLATEHRKTYRDAIEKTLNTFGRREEVLGLVESYRRLKHELGLMDFSDQIELGARLADERREVGAAEREKFKVVLLDEYQDTSVAQALMLSRLFSGDSVDHGRGHPVTAVGDPNQAIYGWRGASVSNILNFGRDFPRSGGSADVAAYSLTVNRRSDARILETANELTGPLYERFPTLQPLRPQSGAAPGVVRAAVHGTYHDELAWLPEQVKQAKETLHTSWREIGVLTRDNSHAADVFDALTNAEIPVEIVGLQGLLRLPEVAEVVATLTLLHDLTANAELLTLLTGPRWAIGSRDLALLGWRARELARPWATSRTSQLSIDEELADAVEGADPTEVVSLCDALDDPGDAGYSTEASERFALLAKELRHLRAYAAEPLLDLVRRIIDTTGIDVELDSSISPAAQARRENLDLFVKAVAEFQAVDGGVSLPALLAYLTTEDEMGTGLDIATPTAADSVKLLTVHRSKGLEYDAVFLVGVAETKFPSTQARTKWIAGPGVLPTPLRGDAEDLPKLTGYDKQAVGRLGLDMREHESFEELRLGYVAFTRARHLLSVSSYCWLPGRKTPAGPSAFQDSVRAVLENHGEKPELWCEKPAKGELNPLQANMETRPWPIEGHTAEVMRRLEASALVREVIEAVESGTDPGDGDLDMVELATVQQWDDAMVQLLAEARHDRADVVEVPLPSSLSATAVARLRDEPEKLAADLARPMPRQPSPSARFGTRFHAWVEARFGQQQLVGLDEVPGRGDAGIEDERELRELIEKFTAGPFGERVPVAVEPPFALVLGGQVVRGRIDAVYADDDGFLVVDWKTNQQQTADPLQLAIYRVAWAELHGIPLSDVRAGFYYVRTGDLVVHDALPDRAALEKLVQPTSR